MENSSKCGHIYKSVVTNSSIQDTEYMSNGTIFKDHKEKIEDFYLFCEKCGNIIKYTDQINFEK
jgi:hypothetical protein